MSHHSTCTTDDVISDQIYVIGRLEYLWNKKGYHKKKNAILLYFEKAFKWVYFLNDLFFGSCALERDSFGSLQGPTIIVFWQVLVGLRMLGKEPRFILIILESFLAVNKQELWNYSFVKKYFVFSFANHDCTSIDKEC